MDNSLIPIREQSVNFYGDEITAALVNMEGEEQIYVPLRLICDNLGLDWSSQRQRTLRHPVLKDAIRSVVVTTTEAGKRDVLALPLDHLPGWLFGVNAARVKAELQDKLIRYQAECFRVLWSAFKGEILPARPPLLRDDLSGAALALEIATAVQALARQQLDMEAKLSQVGDRQQVMADYLRGFIQETRQALQGTGERLDALELRLDEGATVSKAQQAEIALAVRNIGKALEAHGDKNGYAKVYAEMYRRYGISSYKALPVASFDECVTWLQRWFDEADKAGSF